MGDNHCSPTRVVRPGSAAIVFELFPAYQRRTAYRRDRSASGTTPPFHESHKRSGRRNNLHADSDLQLWNDALAV